MLSGVGPAGHLRQHGIAVHADLPVGDNLHDHLFVPMTYCMTSARNRGTTPYFVRRRPQRGDPRRLLDGPHRVRGPGLRPQPGRTRPGVPDLQVHVLPWSYPFPNQDSPARHKVDKRSALTDHAHADLPQEPRHPAARLRRPVRRPGHRPGLPDRTRRRPAAAGRHGAHPRHDGQQGHRRPGQPGAEPRARLPRPGRAGPGTAQPRHVGVPRGRHLPDGHRRTGRGRPRAARPRHRRPPGRRRVDHARHPRRQHERPGHDDRRALCQPYGGQPYGASLTGTSLTGTSLIGPAS